jgi:hypothetical protein
LALSPLLLLLLMSYFSLVAVLLLVDPVLRLLVSIASNNQNVPLKQLPPETEADPFMKPCCISKHTQHSSFGPPYYCFFTL